MKREDWETEQNKHQEKEQGKVGLMTELNREKAKLPWSNKEEKRVEAQRKFEGGRQKPVSRQVARSPS